MLSRFLLGQYTFNTILSYFSNFRLQCWNVELLIDDIDYFLRLEVSHFVRFSYDSVLHFFWNHHVDISDNFEVLSQQKNSKFVDCVDYC